MQAVQAAPGDLDPAFGIEGRLTTDFSSDEFDIANDMTVQSDGKVVTIGRTGAPGDFAISRHNTDGSLDISFSSDGRATTDFGAVFSTEARGVTIQGDGKIVVVGRASGDVALARYNADGSPDTSFSGDGKLTTDFGGYDEVPEAVVVHSDGKILVAGEFEDDFMLARYNADGSPDTSFSGDGRQTTDFGEFASATAREIAVQSNGKIVVAGVVDELGVDLGLARYNADGSPDTSFSGDGKLTTEFGGYNGLAEAVVVHSDGKILVAGGFEGDFALARYNADGSPDTSFSGDGTETTDFGENERARAVVVQSDGRIVLAGSAGDFQMEGWDLTTGDDDFALARYNADGSPDTSFSGDGRQTTEFGRNERARAVAIHSDGKIVTAGTTGNFPADEADDLGQSDFALARHNPDGSLDTTFSGDGKQIVGFAGDNQGSDVAIQADGRVVAVGRAGGDFAVARYNANGLFDTTFSGDGKQTTDFGWVFGDRSQAEAVALQPDGKIVVVGSGAGGYRMAVARFGVDGSLDTSFAGDGKTTIGFGGNLDPVPAKATGVAIQPDGGIVVVGRAGEYYNDDFVIARFNPDGLLDDSFGELRTDLGGPEGATAVALQADGRIVVVGSTAVFGAPGSDIAVVRYRGDGALDTSFSGDGKQIVDLGGVTSTAAGVALDDDGGIVVAGSTDGDFSLARLTTEGSLDTSFATDGMQTVDFGESEDTAGGLVLQEDGGIVMGGASGGDFAVARFGANGSLDMSFADDGKSTSDFGRRDSATAIALQADGKAVLAGSAESAEADFDFGLARYVTGAGVDATAPDTSISSGPSGLTSDQTPTFGFSSSEPGSTFECRIDSGTFTACASPHTTMSLGGGAHTFYVRATDQAGNTDLSPASRSFTVQVPAPPPGGGGTPPPAGGSTPPPALPAGPQPTPACKRAQAAGAKARKRFRSAQRKLRAAEGKAAKRKWRKAVKKRQTALRKARRKTKLTCA